MLRFHIPIQPTMPWETRSCLVEMSMTTTTTWNTCRTNSTSAHHLAKDGLLTLPSLLCLAVWQTASSTTSTMKIFLFRMMHQSAFTTTTGNLWIQSGLLSPLMEETSPTILLPDGLQARDFHGTVSSRRVSLVLLLIGEKQNFISGQILSLKNIWRFLITTLLTNLL